MHKLGMSELPSFDCLIKLAWGLIYERQSVCTIILNNFKQ